MKKATILVLGFILVGCAGSPYALSKMSSSELKSCSDGQIINALSSDLVTRNDSEKLFEESVRRGLFSKSEVRLITGRKIELGMSENVLRASWGWPSEVNRTVNSSGVRKQFVYSRYNGTRRFDQPTYVYVENGVVTSWQD